MVVGVEVYDIGLVFLLIVYFVQFDLDIFCVVMVMVLYNFNGWIGVKMGVVCLLIFGFGEMSWFKEIVLGGFGQYCVGGGYVCEQGVVECFIVDVVDGVDIKCFFKVVVVCGNGMVGVFVFYVLWVMGVEVIEMDCNFDYIFLCYNLNLEDMKMLYVMCDVVFEYGVDVGLGFDGDGDCCGVIDNEGEEIFVDKIGLMFVWDFVLFYLGVKFVVDVKLIGLFVIDLVFVEYGCEMDYYKMGYLYIKCCFKELGVLVGFEKLGYFFLQDLIGCGYDDGLVVVCVVLQMLDCNLDKLMVDLCCVLLVSYGLLIMLLVCVDEVKYGVIDCIVVEYQVKVDQGVMVVGCKIVVVNIVNGVCFFFDDGVWGLV